MVRGLVVDDVATAVHTISHTNYYRLAAYFIPHLPMLNTIKGKVQSGACGSTSEVIRDAMRLW